MCHWFIELKEKDMENNKTYNIVRSMQVLLDLSHCIQLEWQNYMPDNKFKNPIMNQKAKRIREDAEDIKRLCMQAVKMKEEKDFVEIEHPYALLRVFRYFSNVDTNQINEYIDKLEQEPEMI